MKKTKLFIGMLAILLLPICTLLGGCISEKRAQSTSAKSVYAFSALSGAEYLAQNSNNASGGVQSSGVAVESAASKLSTATGRPELIKNDIELINNYVGMFEGYVFNGGLNPVATKPTADDGVYAKYGVKLAISVPSANGAMQNHIMYYSEINSQTNVEIDDDDYENEVKVETTLAGVIVFEGQEFIVSGKKTIETEGNEKEIEIEFTTRSKINNSDYVVVKQEIEQGEVEFEYSIYENGRLVSKSKVEWENEKFEKELSLQFINVTNGVVSNVVYSFEKKVVSAFNTINVKCKSGKTIERFTVKDTGANYTYTYANGFTEQLAKA